jgi:uncharacterized protein (DUF2141 family)
MLKFHREIRSRLVSGVSLLLSTSLFGSTLLATAATAAPATVTIQVSGLRNQKGQVCLSVFNSGRGFPSDGQNAVKSKCVNASQADTIAVQGLKQGSYAVALLHDENNDGKANRNRLGIPTEGFGFSQNPALRAGPPKYGDAVFLATGGNTTIPIQMTYLF